MGLKRDGITQYLFQSPTLLHVAVWHRLCPTQVVLTGAQMRLKDLVCNANMLRQFLTVDTGEAAMSDLQTQLCNVPPHVLHEAERLFLSHLEFSKLFTVGDSDQGNVLNYTSSPPLTQWNHIQRLFAVRVFGIPMSGST